MPSRPASASLIDGLRGTNAPLPEPDSLSHGAADPPISTAQPHERSPPGPTAGTGATIGPVADTRRSSPVPHPADEAQPSACTEQGAPAPSDKYLEEIQEALQDPQRQSSPVAQPVPETITSDAERGPLFERALEPAHASPAVAPASTATDPAALHSHASSPRESGQQSASIAPTEPQNSVATGECLPAHARGALAARRAADEAPVNSPGKKPQHAQQASARRPLPPSERARASGSRASAAPARPPQDTEPHKPPSARGAADAAPRPRTNSRRPHQPIQFVAPDANGEGMSLEEMARGKAWLPGKAKAPAQLHAAPPQPHQAPPQPHKALTQPHKAPPQSHAALRTPVAMAPPVATQVRDGRNRPAARPPPAEHGTPNTAPAQRREPGSRGGSGDDIAHAGSKKRRVEERVGAEDAVGGGGVYGLPLPKAPRRGSEPDLRGAAAEPRGGFISKKPRPGVSAHEPDQRRPRTAAAAQPPRPAETRDRRSLPGPPARLASPRTGPFLLGDDDSEDERSPLGTPSLARSGAAVGHAKIHIVDESDEEPLQEERPRPQHGAAHRREQAQRVGAQRQPPGGHGSPAGRSSGQERVLSGLTEAELARAESLMREEMDTFPAELRLDALAAAAGALYESLFDTCKMYARACVFCARPHPKAKGQCERVREMPRAQRERWREIIARRASIRGHPKAGVVPTRPDWAP